MAVFPAFSGDARDQISLTSLSRALEKESFQTAVAAAAATQSVTQQVCRSNWSRKSRCELAQRRERRGREGGV